MSNPRAFGTIASGNRQKQQEISSAQKNAMLAELLQGKTQKAVADAYNTSPSTAHRILQRWKTEATTENKPRSGRPKKLSPADERYINLMVKRNRQIANSALIGAMDGRISLSTVRRVLRKDSRHKTEVDASDSDKNGNSDGSATICTATASNCGSVERDTGI